MRHLLMITLFCLPLMAGTARHLDGHKQNTNPDLAFIRDHLKAQKAAELAAVLDLSPDQVGALRAVKAEVTRIQTAFGAELDAHDARIAETAAAVRTRLEADGSLSEEDAAALKALKGERREIQARRRESLRQAGSELHGLLTETQIEALKAQARDRREAHREARRETAPERAAARAERAEARAERAEARAARREAAGARTEARKERLKERVQRKAARRVARLLLSDAFIAALPQP